MDAVAANGAMNMLGCALGRKQRRGEEKWLGQRGRGDAEEKQCGVTLAREVGKRSGGTALCPCARVGHAPS